MFHIFVAQHLRAVGQDFTIFVIEQIPGHVFNKAALFNVGFQLIRRDYDYLVLHDVDQVPESLENTYAWPEKPTHLCTCAQSFHYQPSYASMVGGALILQTKHFEEIDGMSNHFFGWGQEDDDLYGRLRAKFGQPVRLTPECTKGRYRSLPHDRVKNLDVTPMFHHGRKQLARTMAGQHALGKPDGASTVRFTVLRHDADGRNGAVGFERVVTQLRLPFMPTNLNQVPPDD